MLTSQVWDSDLTSDANYFKEKEKIKFDVYIDEIIRKN